MNNLDQLNQLAGKAKDHLSRLSACGAVYHAAAIAISAFSEEEINGWDLSHPESCGINRVIDTDGTVFWEASICDYTGDDYTKCTLEDALNAKDWYDNAWTQQL